MSESVRQILARESAGGRASVQGWVKTARHSKGVSFLEVSDGSCFAGLQVVADAALDNFESELRKIGTGFAVEATGELVESPGKGQRYELRAEGVTLVAPAAEGYPLQKKRHSFEFLRTIAHLRPRTNTFGAVLRVRNAASRAIHDFFQERGFVLLHTPIITASDAEGAGEMFRVTTLDAANPPQTGEGGADFGEDFFGRAAFLTVSGQLEAEIGALRAHQRLHLRPHLPRRELQHQPPSRRVLDGRARDGLLRPARATWTWPRRSSSTSSAAVLEHCPDDMAFFDQRIDRPVLETLEHIIESPFERITYTEAVEILERSGRDVRVPRRRGAPTCRASTSAT